MSDKDNPGSDEHLTLARRHVAEGEQRVAHQRKLLEEPRRDGHDTAIAENLLQTFIETLEALREYLVLEEAQAARRTT